MDWSKVVLVLCVLGLLSHSLYCLFAGDKKEDNKPSPYVPSLQSSAAMNAAVEQLLKDPNAQFFTRENMTGEVFIYDSTMSESQDGCQSVTGEGLESLLTPEICVRVFTDRKCRGFSLALYPKADSGSFINFLTPKLQLVYSVGPCLPNEFQYASVFLNGSKIEITKDESNIRQIPDIVDFRGENTYVPISTSVTSTTNPVNQYYMDQGRPKWIGAKINSGHLNKDGGSGTKRNLAIPPGLGGPTNETYNTFPQSEYNFYRWTEVTDQVQSFLQSAKKEDYALVHLTFLYENSTVTTPYGFYYEARYRFGKTLYGYIEN